MLRRGTRIPLGAELSRPPLPEGRLQTSWAPAPRRAAAPGFETPPGRERLVGARPAGPALCRDGAVPAVASRPPTQSCLTRARASPSITPRGAVSRELPAVLGWSLKCPSFPTGPAGLRHSSARSCPLPPPQLHGPGGYHADLPRGPPGSSQLPLVASSQRPALQCPPRTPALLSCLAVMACTVA